MQYRKFGKCDFEVSALGFGCMRLPLVGGKTPIFVEQDAALIDEPAAIEMIRHAIDHGVNYIDTAYNYHKKNSEILVGKALKDGYRDKVKLATKSPVWLAKEPGDFDRLLNEQLQKLDTDYIDLYLLHALNTTNWADAKNLGVLEFLDRALADGRIKYAGFSFHDGIDLFKEIIDSYDWTFCQIQFNYMDEHTQAGLAGLHYAAEKGLAVVVMEPLRGGNLVKNPPREVQELWEAATSAYTPAEWALRWVWNHPEVSVVLSGMSTMEQVQENLRIADTATPGTLTDDEMHTLEMVKAVYRDKTKVACTECGYCSTCPQKLLITDMFSLYNNFFLFDDVEKGRKFYDKMKEVKRDASACVDCGHCEERCPQHLPIRQLLKDVDRVLSAKLA